MKTSTFFIGLTTGAIAAAVTVLYSTPQSGNELRTTVKSASTEMKEKCSVVNEKLNSLKRSISKLTKEAKETVPEAVSGLKDSFDFWQKSTDPNRIRLEQELSAIEDALKSLELSIANEQK